MPFKHNANVCCSNFFNSLQILLSAVFKCSNECLSEKSKMWSKDYFRPQHNSIIKVYTLVNYKICIFLFQTILKQLTDMGFKETRAKKALFLNRCCIVVYSLVGKVLTNLQWLLRDFVTELLWYCKSWDTSRGKSCVQFKVESVSPSPNTNVCMEKLMFVSSEFTSGALL